MRIDATEFGAVTIDAKTYEHDVIIRLSGKVTAVENAFRKRNMGPPTSSRRRKRSSSSKTVAKC